MLQAQVTTGSITGVVKTTKGEAVNGATVTAILESSGTIFSTSTSNVGRFNFPNLPPGGPYILKVTHVGYAELIKKDVYVALGDRYEANLVISVEGQTLETVQITSTKRSGAEKTGASTNITKRQITSTPNLDRSLMGLSKLTPQSNGNSFMGVSTRFNNITVDGSIFNNNFGLSGGGLPGAAGGAQPISIDAVDMIQVNLAPYDVRQAGFTGGGVNAVTRRGTNTITGTVYDYFRPTSFTGKKVKDQTIASDNTSKNTFGFSIGGPIIKNKLFFFGNFETERKTFPGQTNVALRPGVNDNNPNVTPVLASDMDAMSDFLKKTYNYDPGPYEGYNFHLNATKFLARVDWNISDKHRLTVRYNQSEAGNDVLISATNYPTGTASLGGASRRGGPKNGLSFANSNYVQNNNVYSAVVELNSTFSSRLSNQLLASYTYQNDFRKTPNDQFLPFVDIMNGSSVYMSFGTEPYTYKNFLENKTYNVSDNVTYNAGKHTITGGVSFDYMKFINSYGDISSSSYYRYKSISDFETGKAPTAFALTYGNVPGTDIIPSEATFAQFGVYAQDMFAVNDNLKITYGARLDLPYYPQSAAENPALKALTFKDQNYNDVNYDVSKWPKASALISPRVGFTYDVLKDKSFVVRGGTGVFTGRIPFVWLVNQVSDNGVLNTKQTVTDAATLANRTFNEDRNAYIPATIPPQGTTIPSGSKYSATDPSFKMPQIWRSSLAIDKQVYKTWGVTVEAIYSKTLNSPYTFNANAGLADKTKLAGADNRAYLSPANLNSNVTTMAVMTNSNKGYNFALTAQINKKLSDGFEGMVAYTYAIAKDVNSANSDVASSSINTNSIIQDPRIAQLGYSAYSMPHRVMANISYRIEYAKNMLATTVGLYYSGSAQDRYHYKYGFDINNDGSNGNDMLYIPKDASEITFVTNSIKRANGTTDTYTPQQQSDAFFKFIENDKYLSKHKGEYVERYAGLLPWIHQLDFRLLQDFKVKVNNKTHGFQFSLDITNALNMLNKNWGYRYKYNIGTYSDMAILNNGYTGKDGPVNPATMIPQFKFDPTITKGYDVNYTSSSTWGMQIGLRYNFN